jgi:hypothetical protein
MPQSALINKRDSLTTELKFLKHSRHPNPARVRYLEARISGLNKDIRQIGFDEVDQARNNFDYAGTKRNVGEQYYVPNASIWSGNEVDDGKPKVRTNSKGERIGEDNLTDAQRMKLVQQQMQDRYDSIYAKDGNKR